MTKRAFSPVFAEPHARPTKRANSSKSFSPIKIATAEAAAAVDADTPFSQLMKELTKTVKQPSDGMSVVYWMRMCDLRRELSLFLL